MSTIPQPPAELDRELQSLMLEYFKLKIERTTLKHKRSALMNDAECERGEFLVDDCITQLREGQRIELCCDLCTKRNEIYEQIQENSRRRSTITSRVNRYLARELV